MVKVKVHFERTVIDYDFNLSASLPYSIECICILAGIAPNKCKDYALQVATTKQYLTQQDLTNPNFQLNSGAVLHLTVSPEVNAKQALENLRADAKKARLVVWELRNQLPNPTFANKFLSMGGMVSLLDVITKAEGSALAYGLHALHLALQYNREWDKLTEEFVAKNVFVHLSSPKGKVAQNVLQLAADFASSERFGFISVDRNIRVVSQGESTPPYSTVVNCLSNTDVTVQASALRLINTLYYHCPDVEYAKSLTAALENLNFSKMIKKISRLIHDVNLRKQMYVLQSFKLRKIMRQASEQYDKTNAEHEAKLMKLWTSVFPDETLVSRVSEQWKTMGFQNVDPGTDFRGMGLLGLNNLLYFAENKPDVLREIVLEQASRKERDYPVAVVGINVTQALYQIFDVVKCSNALANGVNPASNQIDRVYRVLFDQPQAFQEIYCIAFQMLDYTWDEMKASYMDFPKVLAAVKKQLEAILSKEPATIDTFNSLATKDTTAFPQATPRPQDPPQVKQLKNEIKNELINMVEAQKILHLQDGKCLQTFSSTQKKNKKTTAPYIYIKLSQNQQELSWEPTLAPNNVPTVFTNKISKSEVSGLLVRSHVPHIQKAKNVDPGIVSRTFFIDAKNGVTMDALIAQTMDDYAIVADALRAWLGKPLGEEAHYKEVTLLVDIETKVRLLDLAGITVPDCAPDMPPPPSNYDFVTTERADIPVAGDRDDFGIN